MRLRILLLVAGVLLAPAAWAAAPAEPLVLDERSSWPVAPHLATLLDPEGDLEPAQLAGEQGRARFGAPPQGPIPGYGIIPEVAWARFEIHNPEPHPARLLLSFEYPLTDSVELYLPSRADGDPQGGWAGRAAGDATLRSPDLLRNRFFVFPIEAPAETTLPILVRVDTRSATSFPMRLWRPEAFHYWNHRSQMVYGLLFGAVGLFVLYTAALAVLLRNPACGWFSAYMSCFSMLLAVRAGFIQDLAQGAIAELSSGANFVLIGVLFFCGAKLTRVFLKVRRHAPRADQTLAFLQWLAPVFVPTSLFVPQLMPVVAVVVLVLGPVFTVGLALHFWWRGVPNARTFALGWLVAHATSLIDTLRLGAKIDSWPFMDALLPVAMGLATLFFALSIIEQTYNYQLFARQDPLTGLANRRELRQHLENEWTRNRRHADPIALVMVDVDCFKAFNDRYGHEAGDRCLERISGVLGRFTRRQGDLTARYGGEEFVVLLSGTEPAEARRLAEEMRAGVQESAIAHGSSTVARVVTASFGLAVGVPDEALAPEALLRRADQALYHAKRLGGNRVALASDGPFPEDEAEKQEAESA